MRISSKSAALISFIFLIFFFSLWNDFTSQLFRFLVQKFNTKNNSKNQTLQNGDNIIKTTTEFIPVQNINVNVTTPKALSNPAKYIQSPVLKSNDVTSKPTIVADTEKSENLFPSKWTLGHISMKYLMNNDICNSTHHHHHALYNASRNESGSHEIFAVILIRSFAAHKGIRNKIRQALPMSKLEKLGMRRVFILAQPPKFTIDWEAKTMVSMGEVEQENKEHKDIIMGDFTDTFMHSTYKHLMALQWALRYCPDAKYIFHHEDDFLVDLYQLKFKLDKNLRTKLKQNLMTMEADLIVSELERNDNANDTFTDERKALFFLGYLNEGHLPTKNSSRIWENWMRMRREFPGEYKFPNHVSGGAYVTNMRTAKEIIRISEKVPFYFMDEIHVTGSLREGVAKKKKIPIPIFNIHERFTYNATWLAHCVSPFPEYWCPFYFGHGYVSGKVLTSFYQHGEYCYRRQTCRERTVSFDPST